MGFTLQVLTMVGVHTTNDIYFRSNTPQMHFILPSLQNTEVHTQPFDQQLLAKDLFLHIISKMGHAQWRIQGGKAGHGPNPVWL